MSQLIAREHAVNHERRFVVCFLDELVHTIGSFLPRLDGLELIVANGGVVTLPKVTIPTVADIARVRDCKGSTFSIARYL